jgi:hypothetical protein
MGIDMPSTATVNLSNLDDAVWSSRGLPGAGLLLATEPRVCYSYSGVTDTDYLLPLPTYVLLAGAGPLLQLPG